MTAIEDKAAMQKYCEASVGCLPSNLLPHNIHQYNGNYLQGIFEAKDGGSAEAHGKPNRMSSSVPPAFEGYPVDVRAAAAAFYPEFQKVHQNHPFNVVEAHYYPLNCDYGFPVDARFQYAPFRMSSSSSSSSPNYQPDSLIQEFQYFVVIDFEATCDRDQNIHPQEIIEFPSVLVNSLTGQLEDCFQIYVRPTCNQNLSDFCKELTGIQQNQVDKGVLLGDALLMHDKWLEEKGIKQTNFAVVTWSNWDCRVMLESECRFKNIRKPPYFNRWINLKVPFQEVFGGTRCKLKEAVEMAGLVWEGRAHCGLDDAKNTARLLSNLMHRGFKFTITNSLTWQPTTPPQHQFQTEAANPNPNPMMMQYQQQQQQGKERDIYCLCGVKSSKRTIRKPGPKHGSSFFGCGNWTSNRGAVCSFFEWAAP